MPHLETVAGDAYSKSSHSKIIFIKALKLIIYPLAKHSFLLSSNTVFILSIHKVSTGPSNINQWNTPLVSAAISLIR
jgi:hypothetical protein